MDMILNLVVVAGMWSSFALLVWGAALTLDEVFAPHPGDLVLRMAEVHALSPRGASR
jgi:hypothetical protein